MIILSVLITFSIDYVLLFWENIDVGHSQDLTDDLAFFRTDSSG